MGVGRRDAREAWLGAGGAACAADVVVEEREALQVLVAVVLVMDLMVLMAYKHI